MQYTIEELYDRMFGKVYEVYDIFKNFFGEEYTDLQGLPDNDALIYRLNASNYHVKKIDDKYEIEEDINLDRLNFAPFILVYWPKVTVSNEFNESIVIQDLYAKIEIDCNGKIPLEKHGFTLNRATYTLTQFNCAYMHSHVSSIPFSDFTYFMPPCLGRGPIVRTITSLKTGYDESIWLLFCRELALYVTVESIAGVPYKRLKNITNTGISYRICDFIGDNAFCDFENEQERKFLVDDFLTYYMEHCNLKFSFIKGKYIIGNNFYSTILDISNAFISFYNKTPVDKRPIDKEELSLYIYTVIAKNGKFFTPRGGSSQSPHLCIGKKVCTFKGNEITLNIIQRDTDKNVYTTILKPDYANHLIHTMLNIVNYKLYEYSTETPRTNKTVLYI